LSIGRRQAGVGPAKIRDVIDEPARGIGRLGVVDPRGAPKPKNQTGIEWFVFDLTVNIIVPPIEILRSIRGQRSELIQLRIRKWESVRHGLVSPAGRDSVVKGG
jgi:hypothetical protein